tara:strand:+ start:5647 stop:6735 length:1089 start_codon:yes stop_codon:yes gene_type:complete
MQVKINSKILIELIKPLDSVINPSHSVPILQSIKMKINNDSITAVGDNHEVRCSNKVDFNTGIEKDFCINHSMFVSALKNIENQEITIDFEQNKILLTHKKGEFSIPVEGSELFPDLEVSEFDKKAKIKVEPLKKSLKVATRFIIDDNLDPMSNLSIEFKKKQLVVRSTNKISLYRETLKSSGDPAKILLSGKSAAALFALVEDSEEKVKIRYNDSKIYFKIGQKEIYIIQQKGDFPITAFDRILGAVDNSDEFKVSQDDLVKSIKRVCSLSMREKYQRIKIIFEKKNLNLSIENEISSSSAYEDLACIYKSDRKVISFNAKLMVEILSVFGKDCQLKITPSNQLCLKTEKSVGLLAPLGDV